MTDDAILDAAVTELRKLEPPKLWMTARGLSRRIRGKYPGLRGLSQPRVFDVLLKHARSKRPPRKIRNSRYPSVNTLEVLWGAIVPGRLEERSVDPPTLRADGAEPDPRKILPTAPEALGEREDLEGFPTYFLSYNFEDTRHVKKVVQTLELDGHSVWMAGARIVDGANINSEVIAAMKGAGKHLLYLSAHSLRSLWVGKETLVAETLELPRTIVVKGNDRDLMRLVRHWIAGGRSSELRGIERYRGVSALAAQRFQDILKEYVRDERSSVYLYPDPYRNAARRPERMLGLSSFPKPEPAD